MHKIPIAAPNFLAQRNEKKKNFFWTGERVFCNLIYTQPLAGSMIF